MPDEAATDEATPDEAATDEAMPDEATPDEATPDEATPDEATPDEATPDEATPDEAMPDEATPDEATPDEATPSEPKPAVSVAVLIDTPEDGIIYEGDTITLTAVITADDPSMYVYQWQTSGDGEQWIDLEGEQGLTLAVEMTESNMNDYWRILVKDSAGRKGNQQ